ncbi:restriction endonuclease subunit S [Brachyspira aalborgi]|uniref:Restriction endonuclease subunit S n=1 Tax=Brachyspira aalborgi TaxID=29522 RepID=A0A5C8EKZ3_9SPIR|nr:restriction endonuclease subunit S [Brachyspira aalborgi]TXJ37631.1 restriction endonuclease subunit S [Brachyspira aalborgi]
MNKLPNGWTEYKLKDIMSISSKRYNPNKDTKNYKCIELEHIESETGILNGHTNSKDIHSVKNVFEKGEVLYGKLRPYLKKFYLAKFDGVCSSEIWVLKGKKVINDFLYYFIQQDNFNYIANVSIGMIMPRADWSYMSEISFNIPPLDEQKRIASALSKIDAYLENTIKLIEEKERFKRGIAKKLLTCKEGENIPEARFKGFEDEWETKTLENICKNIKTGKLNANAMEKDGQYRFYTCAKDYYKINTYAFDGEAILISGNGAHVGYVHYYNGKFNAYQRTYVLMDFTENILFIKYYLDIHLKYKINIENNKGNIPYIVLNTIKDMEIKFPSLEEQEKIGGYLSLLDAEIDNLKKQKELIKEMKRGAMQKLLSGEVRLLE